MEIFFRIIHSVKKLEKKSNFHLIQVFLSLLINILYFI